MKHYLLFTGHMIDKDGRSEKRFPQDKEISAKEKIKQVLVDISATIHGPFAGIAGGACGGDILFHECCAELGIPSKMYLALPPNEFKITSVSFAGKDWSERFDSLIHQLPVVVLPDNVYAGEGYNIWQRANLWMLDAALQNGRVNMTLIVLWDGSPSNAEGGAAHMVEIAKLQRLTIAHINTALL
ncbi:hypothetical protein [Mucilaginibacter lacusdianchii]|uniref:hypothetical protein n=1 Tax=Mucilaginibacter lacusdianchii TaxID=2684211 RepID=UPI00131BCF1B|nr:hypothetical protein [Mucilaginibacter sp. JXJ CY 39]